MSKPHNYDQSEVNENMENLLDISTPTIQDKMKKIIRSKDKEVVPLENNQNNQLEVPKKKGRGGARVGGGRKLGSTQKLSATSLLDAIAKIDVPFEQGIAEDYYTARQSGDMNVIQKYQSMILSKVIADKQELDVTSKGEQLGIQLVFNPVELPEWKK